MSPVLSSAAQNSFRLQKVWETIDFNSCPYHYNFHMHTVASDGRLTASEMVEQAVNIGLQGFAITDHHSVNGYKKAQAHLNKVKQNGQAERLTLWTGVEITSRLLGVDVHILGYAFDPEHSVLQTYLQSCSPQGESAEAEVVINCLHQAGGLAVLAHPHRYRLSAQELIPVAARLGIDGVEAYYAYKKSSTWFPTPKKTEEALHLASEYNLHTTCGTDTHGSNLLQRV